MIKNLLLIILFPALCSAQTINNLDIKNGFLQFHLGDSVSKFKQIASVNRSQPNYMEAKFKYLKLNRYLDRVGLYFENNTLSKIEVSLISEDGQSYIDTALKKAYGVGQPFNSNAEVPARHKVDYTIWAGKRVTVVRKKDTYNIQINYRDITSTIETITFSLIDDVKIEGELPPDFEL